MHISFSSSLQLFERDPTRRLGVVGNIRSSSFFKTINWQALERREIEPPFKPKVVRPTHKPPDAVCLDYRLCFYCPAELLLSSVTESSKRLQQLWPGILEWEASSVLQRQELHRLHGSVGFLRFFIYQPQDGAPFRKVTLCNHASRNRPFFCIYINVIVFVCMHFICLGLKAFMSNNIRAGGWRSLHSTRHCCCHLSLFKTFNLTQLWVK